MYITAKCSITSVSNFLVTKLIRLDVNEFAEYRKLTAQPTVSTHSL